MEYLVLVLMLIFAPLRSFVGYVVLGMVHCIGTTGPEGSFSHFHSGLRANDILINLK